MNTNMNSKPGAIRVRTNVKAGWPPGPTVQATNHSQTLRVRTNVKAGIIAI